MAEHLQNIQNQTVSLDTYNIGREARVVASELKAQLLTPDNDLTSENYANCGNFVMRLLNQDHESALDRLVRVVGADELSDPKATEGPRPLLIYVRHLFEDGSAGGVESPIKLAEDGIILNDNEHTPNLEKGYFVGVPGIGAEDFYFSTAYARKPVHQLEAEDAIEFREYSDEFSRRSII